MRKYKSAIFKHLHEEFKEHLKYGGITQEEMDEFERDCFKDTPDTPPSRPAQVPTLAAAGSTRDPRAI
jgi:putative transcriptional regulator